MPRLEPKLAFWAKYPQAPITLDRDNDNDPVVSLREIADETINKDDLREEFIHAMQKQWRPMTESEA